MNLSEWCTDLVLDAGAIISGETLTHFGSNIRYWTIAEVVGEIKDSRSRSRLQAFPFKLELKKVSDEALAFVAGFARKTGDFFSLSATDLKVIALAYMLEVEKYGKGQLRDAPLVHDERPQQKRKQQKQQQRGQEHVRFADVFEARPFSLDNLLHMDEEEYYAEIGAPVPEEMDMMEMLEEEGGDEVEAGAPAPAAVEPVEEPAERKSLVDTVPLGPTAVHDEEGDWITPENLHMQGIGVDEQPHKGSQSSVACVTTDFSMQNVLMQIGLRLVTVNGLAISEVRQWVLRCHSCWLTTRDMSRQFCPACGNYTMVRMSALVKQNGKVLYRGGLKKIFNKRGTKYSIPKPKGGRWNTDPVLREDEVVNREHQRINRHRNFNTDEIDPFKDAIEFGHSKVGGNQRHERTFGFSGSNPNIPKRRSGKKKKSKRTAPGHA